MATLHSRMFIAQSTLESWVDSGRVDVGKDTVRLHNVGRTYRIEPAVRFLATVEGGATELVGKVLTERRVGELGGELMGDSVIFGDSAFQVEAGYIGTLEREGVSVEE
jgi:hypothetical protein